MNQLPDKIVGLYPPVIANTAHGRYAIYSGSQYGWFEVDETFTHEDAMSRWVRMEFTNESPVSSEHRTWEVENSKKNGFYTVRNHANNWSCSCPAGMYHRKECKHIRQIKESI